MKKEEEKEGKKCYALRSSESNNESKMKPRNGSQKGPVISTKIRKQIASSSKKKKIAKSLGENSVNDIRKYFEVASISNNDESDLVAEKSNLHGSSRIVAENNTNQCLANEHQQLLAPTHETGLSGGCQVPRDSNSGLKPREREKQVQIPPKLDKT